MYVRVYEGLGQPPEVVRDFEEQKQRFEVTKAEHEKGAKRSSLATEPPAQLESGEAGTCMNARSAP